jgi:DNA repair protein RadC
VSTRIQTTTDALALLAPHSRHLEYETLQALFLGADGTLIQHATVSRGTADQTSLCIRTVLGTALAMGAQAIIVAHNHPNGNPEPSVLDVRATYRLLECARAVGLVLVDHLVITATDHRSMRAMGMLPDSSA